MTFVKKGIVITLGASGQVDDTHIIRPSPILINNKTYLYYSAHDGANWRAALAVGDDGMNFVKKGIVIPIGGAVESDDVHTVHPLPILINDKTYLYYSGYDGTYYRASLAIGNDGMNFVKKGVVVPLGAPGEADDTHIYSPSAITINDKIYLYYSAQDGANYRISLAISDDGMNFVKKGVVVPIGEVGEVDDVHTAHPSPILINGKIYLYHSVYDGTNWRASLAVSNDGMNFVKKGIVIPLGASGEVDDVHTAHPSPISINDKIYLYHSVYDGTNWRAALAISEDGF